VKYQKSKDIEKVARTPTVNEMHEEYLNDKIIGLREKGNEI
jgi:hypothetical protein